MLQNKYFKIKREELQMTKTNYDKETERLHAYFKDGYNYGLKRFKEIANDNPDFFEIDSLNNINVVINDMLKPSKDHNNEDVEDKKKEKENKIEKVTEAETGSSKEEKDITFLKEEQEIIDDLHDIQKHLNKNAWNTSIKTTDVYLLEKAKSLIERLYNLKTKDEDTLINKIKNESIDTEEVGKLDITYDTDEFAEVFDSPLQNKMGDVMDYFQTINFLSKMILNFDKDQLISKGDITKDSTYELLCELVLSWGSSLYELNYEFMKFANLINTGKAEFIITLD